MQRNKIQIDMDFMRFQNELISNQSARRILLAIKVARKKGETGYIQIGCEEINIVKTKTTFEVRYHWEYENQIEGERNYWEYSLSHVRELEAWLKAALKKRKEYAD